MRLASFLLGAALLACTACIGDDCGDPQRRVCDFNSTTGAYDRDCRMVCPSYRCPSGVAPVLLRCAWNQAGACANGAYYCPQPFEAGSCDEVTDGGRTTYYSNDPRCLPRG